MSIDNILLLLLFKAGHISEDVYLKAVELLEEEAKEKTKGKSDEGSCDTALH